MSEAQARLPNVATSLLLRILVTVKAYPAVGRRHGEAVCVAGIDLDTPRWIRLFPVPFRDLPFTQRFRKFDIVELQASESSDPRPESYKPNADSIRVIGHLRARRAAERRRHIEPLMRQSMCAIRREQQESRASLGIFRPLAPPELRIVEERSAWEPEKQMIVHQPSMLMPGRGVWRSCRSASPIVMAAQASQRVLATSRASSTGRSPKPSAAGETGSGSIRLLSR